MASSAMSSFKSYAGQMKLDRTLLLSGTKVTPLASNSKDAFHLLRSKVQSPNILLSRMEEKTHTR
ncbi:hypothetical protein VNI00_003758 [Paramarasmius palmivorus]|uniref:Uncharacterized protein n=1 Tax=Paramarasmius palmivorus TaxID=297713 RepID=A0AAW0DPS3_9AGAR